MASARASGGDKRRMILDAAVIAFAKRGFHACRVSDIADEANVAYGLVYHYFRSKDEVLDTLFVERWNILLEFISETDRQPLAPRDKLHAIAAAIIDFYRYDPALMKVINGKTKGKKLPAVSEKPTPPTKVVDLVERLRESLAAAQKSSRPKRAARARKRSAA